MKLTSWSIGRERERRRQGKSSATERGGGGGGDWEIGCVSRSPCFLWSPNPSEATTATFPLFNCCFGWGFPCVVCLPLFRPRRLTAYVRLGSAPHGRRRDGKRSRGREGDGRGKGEYRFFFFFAVLDPLFFYFGTIAPLPDFCHLSVVTQCVTCAVTVFDVFTPIGAVLLGLYSFPILIEYVLTFKHMFLLFV